MMNPHSYKKRCAKCGKYREIAGGHQKMIPGRGMYFVCAGCKHLIDQALPRK